MNRVDATQQLRGHVLTALVCSDGVSTEWVAVPFLAGAVHVFDGPAGGEPFTPKAAAGLGVERDVHLLLAV